MPSVIDTPEIEQLDHEQQLHDQTPPRAPRQTTSRRGLASRLTMMLSVTAAWLKRHIHHDWRVVPGTPQVELPADSLARRHPYIYIKAMSG
jgi:hypothetical protein